jgi:hypothetical protein
LKIVFLEYPVVATLPSPPQKKKEIFLKNYLLLFSLVFSVVLFSYRSRSRTEIEIKVQIDNED